MMPECETMQALLSGYVDDELDTEQRRKVETHLDICPSCRNELRQMNLVAEAASQLSVRPLPDDVWDTFLEDVYNRLERRTGWVLFWAGLCAVLLYGVYHFALDPWATPLQKALVALPAAGACVLFVSVLRQRLFVARTDRYSRDVKR